MVWAPDASEAQQATTDQGPADSCHAQPSTSTPGTHHQPPNLREGDKVTYTKHLDYGVGHLISKVNKKGQDAWYVNFPYTKKLRQHAIRAIDLQPVPKEEQQLPSKIGQQVQCVSGIHHGKVGTIVAGGSSRMASVKFSDTPEPLLMPPRQLHVISDADGPGMCNWPRQPMQRKAVPLAELRSFLKEYQQDADFPSDLQLQQPRSALALQFLLRERPLQDAQGMYLNCLKSTPKAFNVTADTSKAAEAQGVTLNNKPEQVCDLIALLAHASDHCCQESVQPSLQSPSYLLGFDHVQH